MLSTERYYLTRNGQPPIPQRPASHQPRAPKITSLLPGLYQKSPSCKATLFLTTSPQHELHSNSCVGDSAVYTKPYRPRLSTLVCKSLSLSSGRCRSDAVRIGALRWSKTDCLVDICCGTTDLEKQIWLCWCDKRPKMGR